MHNSGKTYILEKHLFILYKYLSSLYIFYEFLVNISLQQAAQPTVMVICSNCWHQYSRRYFFCRFYSCKYSSSRASNLFLFNPSTEFNLFINSGISGNSHLISESNRIDIQIICHNQTFYFRMTWNLQSL